MKQGLGYLAQDPGENVVPFVHRLADGRTPFLWITSRPVDTAPDGGDLLRVTTLRGGMATADPRRLQDLKTAATTFFDERGPGTLVLDCLEPLILHAGVERALRFVEDLHEEVAMRSGILVVFADPRTVTARMIAWLERELDPLPRSAMLVNVEYRVVV